MNNKELKANAIVGVGALDDPHFEENTLESPTAYTNSKSKIKTLTSDHKGITLIALVITIIIMLILVAVTVTVSINGGLFTTAKQATADTQYHADREMLLSAVIGAIGSNAEVDFTELDKNLPEGFTKAEDGGYMSKAGNTFYVDKNGNITDEPLKTAAQLFDVAAEKITNVKKKTDSDFNTDGNLHIGDFINYTAGDWKQEEINAIRTGKNDSLQTANGKNDELPKTAYQFGGFAAGNSRDGNAKPYDDSYNGIKDLEGKEITGWRIFDVNEGTITLISAGCPEDYYHSYGDGYESEYILSGNKNSSASSLNLDGSYTKRNWDVYKAGKATKANAITKADLDNWYKKYMEAEDNFDSCNDDDTFQSVYNTRYENLIDNYSYYWLASANYSTSVYYVNPYYRYVSNGDGYADGVRVLITLKSDIQLSKSGTVTVKKLVDDDNYGGPYTYNVWNIQ